MLKLNFLAKDGLDHLAAVLAIVDYKRPNLTRLPSLDYLAFTAGLSADKFRTFLEALGRRKLVTTAGTDEELEVRLDGLLEEIRVKSAGR